MYKILKAFLHSDDGTTAIAYEIGETREVKPDLVEGLKAEGYIEAVVETPALVTTPVETPVAAPYSNKMKRYK